jgi:5-formyltetrahydrofolate cyclo-ligase
MNEESVAERKAQLRASFRRNFKSIPPGRQIEASMRAVLGLGPILASFKNILSFSNVDSEVDTEPLNALFAQRGQLLLPKVEGKGLRIFRVSDPDSQLVRSPWNVLEPIPDLCEEVNTSEINFILVPAIAFDKKNFRLGRGKGYYDRILDQLPDCPAYGLGLKEQLSEEPLPIDDHDVQLTGLYLF